MAGTTEYAVGVKLLGDSTNLKAAVTTAEDAITDLNTQVTTSTAAIPASVDSTTTSLVNTSGRKLKAAGKAVGTDFAQSLTAGITSGDVAGTVSGLFTSLSMVGGAAALGIGLGGALITGILKGAEQNAAELRAGVNELLSGVENEFKGSLKSILKDIRGGVTEISVLEDLGGEGGLTGGLEKARAFADELGISLSDVVDVLEGKMNPATQAVLEKIRAQEDATTDVYKAGVKVGEVESFRAKSADEILGLYEAQNTEISKAKQDATDLFRLTHDTANATAGLKENSEAYANALERADAAARLLAGRRLPSSDVMNGTG